MVIQRGDVWWASSGEPRGSELGFRRPVLVVQADEFNRSRIGTVVVAALTSNVRLAVAPGNVLVKAQRSGLGRDSVVNVSQIMSLDKGFLTERIGKLEPVLMSQVEVGLKLILAL